MHVCSRREFTSMEKKINCMHMFGCTCIIPESLGGTKLAGVDIVS